MSLRLRLVKAQVEQGSVLEDNIENNLDVAPAKYANDFATVGARHCPRIEKVSRLAEEPPEQTHFPGRRDWRVKPYDAYLS